MDALMPNSAGQFGSARGRIMKRGRKLRPDELDLWQQVARQVVPLSKSSAFVQKSDKRQAPQKYPTRNPDPLPLPEISGGKTPLKDDLAPSLAQSLDRQHVQMDQKAFKRMRRGRVQPDGKIDLHGMTLDRAHSALVRFVMRQQAAGKRLLLVITGKGKSHER